MRVSWNHRGTTDGRPASARRLLSPPAIPVVRRGAHGLPPARPRDRRMPIRGPKPGPRAPTPSTTWPVAASCASIELLEFAVAVEAAGIRHRYIQPRRPQQNGKVERSHRIDNEEFWSRHHFDEFDAAAAGLRKWETHYNTERFSVALKGRTPAEKLAMLLPVPAV